MVRDDLKAKVAEKLARKREKLLEKVADAEARKAEIQAEMAEIQTALTALETELASAEAAAPGARERLLARRERLLAKKERLEWKLESLDIRIEALRDASEQLEFQDEMLPPFVRIPPVPGVPPAPPVPPPPPPRPASRRLEEERLRILQMVAEGKISAADAARLLEALAGSGEGATEAPAQPRVLRIKVTDVDTNTVRVNMTLPLNFVRAALRRGARNAPDINVGGVTLDAEELEALLSAGMQGHIIDIVDEKDGERVEVFVE